MFDFLSSLMRRHQKHRPSRPTQKGKRKSSRHERAASLKKTSLRMIARAQRRQEYARQLENAEHSADETSLAKSTRTIATFTKALDFVGLLSAGISVFQWREMNSGGVDTHALAEAAKAEAEAMSGQWSEMKTQQIITIAQLRANIRMDNMQVQPLHNETGNLVGYVIGPSWRNSGSTDAINFVSWFDVKIGSKDASRAVTKDDCLSIPYTGKYSDPIIFQAGIGVSAMAKNIMLEDVKDASNGTKFITIYGHIDYRNIFQDTKLYSIDWCEYIIPNDINQSKLSFPILFYRTN
jgi:hypothetical protein